MFFFKEGDAFTFIRQSERDSSVVERILGIRNFGFRRLWGLTVSQPNYSFSSIRPEDESHDALAVKLKDAGEWKGIVRNFGFCRNCLYNDQPHTDCYRFRRERQV